MNGELIFENLKSESELILIFFSFLILNFLINFYYNSILK